MAERGARVVAVHEPEAAGHRPVGGVGEGEPLGVVDGEAQAGRGEARRRLRHHRLGEVDAEGPSFGEAVGERPRRHPGPAADVAAVPPGVGGEQVEAAAGERRGALGPELLVRLGDAPPGVAHPGLLGGLVERGEGGPGGVGAHRV